MSTLQREKDWEESSTDEEETVSVSSGTSELSEPIEEYYTPQDDEADCLFCGEAFRKYCAVGAKAMNLFEIFALEGRRPKSNF